MRITSGWRLCALLAFGLMAVAIQAKAQNIWLRIDTPADTVGISNNLTFTITVTNLTTVSQTVVVTNVMPATAQFVSVSFGLVSYPYTNIGPNVIFSVGTLTNTGIAQMAVTIEPTNTGYITNTVWVATNGVAAIMGPVRVLVTNAIPVADLTVAMTGPASQVFSNDWMVYGVNVTNLGPGAAPGVYLTNTLPPGVGFKTNSPSSQVPLIRGSNVVFSLGTLASGAFINYKLTVQPTNAGNLTFVSVLNTNTVLDPNLANNSASTNIAVSNFFAGQLVAYTNSAQVPNGQVGYLEQAIVVTNTGSTTVAAARVIVSGLTNRLANAVGTNNGNPFVVYSSSLDPTQSVGLLLQFYPNRTPFAFGSSQLHPVEVTPLDLTPPANLSSNVNFTGIFRMPSGGMLLEFPTLTNRTYTVEYSSNLLSTNWLAVQPAIVAPANYTFWIDYGPPATLSHPTNSPLRFYRVFLNP